MCIDRTDEGPCVDQRGIDATIVPHIDNSWNTLACTVSKLIAGVKDERGRVRRLTDGPSIGVSYVRVEFSDLFKLISVN